MKNRYKKGFTLIELIVVIAILATLAAIALPSMTGLIKKAKMRVDATNAKSLANCALAASMDYEPRTLGSATMSPAESFTKHNTAKVNITDPKTGENYRLVFVAFSRRGQNAYGKTTNFIAGNTEGNIYAEAVSELVGTGMRYIQYKGKNGNLVTYQICYREDDPSRIEIWAGPMNWGSYTVGESIVRLYPDPFEDY